MFLQIRYPTRTRTYLELGPHTQDAFLEYEAVYVIVVRRMRGWTYTYSWTLTMNII